MNVATFGGRLTADPELKTTTTGKTFCNFCIAVNSSMKNADGTNKADFINGIAWNKTAELIANNFTKGQMLVGTGSITTGSYTNKDNVKIHTTSWLCNSLTFVESKKKASPTVYAPDTNSSGLDDFSAISDDNVVLPF